MRQLDWSQFSLKVDVKKSLSEVYAFFATPAGWEKWFLRKANFTNNKGERRRPNDQISVQDNYQFLWYGYSDSVTEQGKVLSCNQESQICISFSNDAPVDFSLSESNGITIVTLHASGIKTDEHSNMSHFVEDSRGWVFYLTNLKAVIEHGVDLRNRDESITGVITA